LKEKIFSESFRISEKCSKIAPKLFILPIKNGTKQG